MAQEARGWISSLPVYYLYGEGVEIGGRARQARTSPAHAKGVGRPLFSTLFGGKISYMECPRDRQHSLN